MANEYNKIAGKSYEEHLRQVLALPEQCNESPDCNAKQRVEIMYPYKSGTISSRQIEPEA
jgi:hypothetical protein